MFQKVIWSRTFLWNISLLLIFILNFMLKFKVSFSFFLIIFSGLPWWLRCERIHLQWRRPEFYPWLGRSPGGGHGNPLQYSCLENPDGQRSLVGYSPWGHRVRHDWATQHSTAQSFLSTVFPEILLINHNITSVFPFACGIPSGER